MTLIAVTTDFWLITLAVCVWRAKQHARIQTSTQYHNNKHNTHVFSCKTQMCVDINISISASTTDIRTCIQLRKKNWSLMVPEYNICEIQTNIIYATSPLLLETGQIKMKAPKKHNTIPQLPSKI